MWGARGLLGGGAMPGWPEDQTVQNAEGSGVNRWTDRGQLPTLPEHLLHVRYCWLPLFPGKQSVTAINSEEAGPCGKKCCPLVRDEEN